MFPIWQHEITALSSIFENAFLPSALFLLQSIFILFYFLFSILLHFIFIALFLDVLNVGNTEQKPDEKKKIHPHTNAYITWTWTDIQIYKIPTDQDYMVYKCRKNVIVSYWYTYTPETLLRIKITFWQNM